MSKIIEFVQDADGRNSSTRLCMVFGVFVGGMINLWMAYEETLTESIFGIFMASAAGIYSWGKYRESTEKVEQIKADNPQPAPILQAATPATVIQVGKPDAHDMNVSADTVNVSKKVKKNVRT